MEHKVSDTYRKNELSFSPGGDEVTAVFKNGKRVIYDKIKIVDAYCNKLKKDPEIVEILVNAKPYWSR